MKKTIILLGFLILAIPSVSFAHGGNDDEIDSGTAETEVIEPCEIGSVIKCGDHGEGSSKTLDAVVNDLLIGFDKESVDQLDCNEIVDHDFGHLGEALMLYMHPQDEERSKLESAVGEDGEESLTSMRVFMGKRYLGCDDESYGPMMMSFDKHDSFMRGAKIFHHGASMAAFQVISWILAIIGLISLIKFFLEKNKS